MSIFNVKQNRCVLEDFSHFDNRLKNASRTDVD